MSKPEDFDSEAVIERIKQRMKTNSSRPSKPAGKSSDKPVSRAERDEQLKSLAASIGFDERDVQTMIDAHEHFKMPDWQAMKWTEDLEGSEPKLEYVPIEFLATLEVITRIHGVKSVIGMVKNDTGFKLMLGQVALVLNRYYELRRASEESPADKSTDKKGKGDE